MEITEDAAGVVMVMAVVDALRRYVRGLDGWRVLVIVAAVSLSLAFLRTSEQTPRAIAARALLLFVGAIGGTNMLYRIADKARSASLAPSEPPPPPAPPERDPSLPPLLPPRPPR
jgi:FlaA1/EpsC-like NDP-sugar epimerase